MKNIEVRVKNLYKVDMEDCASLTTKAEMVQSHDVSEFWHKILGHFDHGTLNIMQQITTGLPKGSQEQQDTCKGCTSAMYTTATFHDCDITEHVVLERIHFDVYGPFSITSTARHKFCHIY